MVDKKYVLIVYHTGFGYDLKSNDAEGKIKSIKINKHKYYYREWNTRKGYYMIVIEFGEKCDFISINKIIKGIIKKYGINSSNGVAFLHGNNKPFPNDFSLSNIPTNIYSGDTAYAYLLLDLIFKKRGYKGNENWQLPNWEKLIEEVQKKSLIKPLSFLKHRIMTSFLDLDIDWQGIKEVNEKDKENAKEYLNDILKGKSNNYYCQKLVNLWFYLTGKNDLKIDDKVTTSLDKKDLPYEKSVLDLINKSTKEIKENLEKRLRTLLKHVELENENKNKSEKVPSVIDYLKNLDKMIKDKKERDINKFLNFDFHEWYLKLGDLLEELKSFLE
jgi:hypothetical protein